MNNEPKPAEKRIKDIKTRQLDIDRKLIPGLEVFSEVISTEKAKNKDINVFMTGYDRAKDPDGSALYAEIRARELYVTYLEKLEILLSRASKRDIETQSVLEGVSNE